MTVTNRIATFHEPDFSESFINGMATNLEKGKMDIVGDKSHIKHNSL